MCIFSLQYQYIIKQTGNENKDNNLTGDIVFFTKLSVLQGKCLAVTKDNLLSDIGVTPSFRVEMLFLRLRKNNKNRSIMITATADEKPIITKFN